MTYRFRGHYIGDPGIYRTKKELETWRKKDPIERLKKSLTKNKILSAKDIRKIEEEAAAKIKDAEEFALDSPEPKGEEAFLSVYESID